jgi:hypothetical protein
MTTRRRNLKRTLCCKVSFDIRVVHMQQQGTAKQLGRIWTWWNFVSIPTDHPYGI